MTEGADPALLTQRQLFFITGASRSGTTLLSFVLRNHRDVFGLKELQFFGEAWDPRTGNRHFSQTQAIEACASIIARQQDGILAAKSTAARRSEASALIASLGEGGSDPAVVFAAAVHKLAEASGKSIPCEQTPRYVFYARALLDIYPAAHIVHMVRDPRAVMASQKMRWQRRRLAADGSAVPRYQSLRVWVNYHPYTVTRMWSQATRAALALAEHPRVTLLRFEDLVQRPEATVRGLCTRLGLEYDARMLDVGQINSSHQSSAGGARRGLQSGAIDKWRSVLTRTETAIVERDCAQLMRHFAYQKTDPGAISLLHKFGYRLGYLAHLGGVLLVNPRRAYVQGRAMLHARARHPAAGVEPEKVPAHGDPPGLEK